MYKLEKKFKYKENYYKSGKMKEEEIEEPEKGKMFKGERQTELRHQDRERKIDWHTDRYRERGSADTERERDRERDGRLEKERRRGTIWTCRERENKNGHSKKDIERGEGWEGVAGWLIGLYTWCSVSWKV